MKPLFPPYLTGCPSRLDNRTAFNVILWLMRSNADWCDLHERYGHWKTVNEGFRTYVTSGLFENVFPELIVDPDIENLNLDLTVIHIHQKTAKLPRLT
ncbi:hypothetical protein C1940_16735 (plasmid) [Lactiplantibacillus plantarum subsp. plantarum]|uniref:transposase n=1 Tax=Lactiplantibacillus plantarum TaxID=1590 RepID=UPI000CD330D8|nr:hypothetical protein C1940_16735 [Lactiplantibacillus plantarum subsp. plantarum]